MAVAHFSFWRQVATWHFVPLLPQVAENSATPRRPSKLKESTGIGWSPIKPSVRALVASSRARSKNGTRVPESARGSSSSRSSLCHHNTSPHATQHGGMPRWGPGIRAYGTHTYAMDAHEMHTCEMQARKIYLRDARPWHAPLKLSL
jgi:hypothetical protein